MDKFVSIGVNQGDAFYLERSEVKILIDGGKARLGFPIQFEKTIGTQVLDVVVCTHADADHINGLLGIFETGFKVKEIWLPGKWTSRLKDLLINQEHFIEELIVEIRKIDMPDAKNLEELTESQNFSEINMENYEDDEINLNIEVINKAIEEASVNSDLFDNILGERLLFHTMIHYGIHVNQYKLFFDAIETAKKIRDLAILAYHSGSKIRWFEFQNTGSASGGEDYLKPVNSTEIFNISKPLSALLYLYVSKANKESLVFYSPSKDKSNCVLFSADSDFSFQQPLPKLKNNLIITAPHHGSEHNLNAYTRLNSGGYITPNTIIVRSDGKFKKRPGTSYLNSISKKICTLCRNPNSQKQDVIFNFSSSKWVLQNSLVWCKCI